jgi:hypothetical protein
VGRDFSAKEYAMETKLFGLSLGFLGLILATQAGWALS